MRFVEAQKPLIMLLKLCGFFGYQTNTLARCTWKRRILNLIVNFFFATQYFINTISVIDIFVDQLDDGYKVTYMFNVLEPLMGLLNILTINYCIACTQKKQIEFLQCLQSIDDDVRKLPFYNNEMEKFYKFLRISSWGSIVSLITFYVILVLIYAKMALKNQSRIVIPQLFSFMLYSIYFTLLVTLVLHLVLAIEKFFQIINKGLRLCISGSDFYMKEIRTLLRLHHKLTYAIQTLNESFGLVIFGNFVFFSVLTTIEFYYIYDSFTANLVGSSLIIWYDVLNVIWMVPMFFYLMWLCGTCSSVQKVAEETKGILESSESEQLEEFIGKCLMNSFQANYSFTGNGLIIVDYTMIFNVRIRYNARS